MNKAGFRRRPLVILLVMLTFTSIAFAAGTVVKFQGKVMELDLKRGTMSVNEKRIVWDQQTAFHNERGAPIAADSLKVRGWVYIEGISDPLQERISARKVYLLPKYIYQKERHLYSFLAEE
jgi:hypothetical protein